MGMSLDDIKKLPKRFGTNLLRLWEHIGEETFYWLFDDRSILATNLGVYKIIPMSVDALGELEISKKMGKLGIGPKVIDSWGEATDAFAVLFMEKADCDVMDAMLEDVTFDLPKMFERVETLLLTAAMEGFMLLDVKPENILKMDNGRLLLADFEPYFIRQTQTKISKLEVISLCQAMILFYLTYTASSLQRYVNDHDYDHRNWIHTFNVLKWIVEKHNTTLQDLHTNETLTADVENLLQYFNTLESAYKMQPSHQKLPFMDMNCEN